jgi:hypothetical protein
MKLNKRHIKHLGEKKQKKHHIRHGKDARKRKKTSIKYIQIYSVGFDHFFFFLEKNPQINVRYKLAREKDPAWGQIFFEIKREKKNDVHLKTTFQ